MSLLAENSNPTAHSIAETMLDNGFAVKKVLEVANKFGTVTRRVCETRLAEFSETVTPYGKVATTMDILLDSGATEKAVVNNPFAMLHAACSLSLEFGAFLVKHKAKSLIFYTDATTPGNQLRPDAGRSHEAMLWSFAELPHWFLSRGHGWFRFAYVLVDVVHACRGGMAEITKQMLRTFFHPSDFNFETTGVRLPTPAGLVHVTAKFCFFCLEEKACKFLFNVK